LAYLAINGKAEDHRETMITPAEKKGQSQTANICSPVKSGEKE
jgi:hypothetical protein